MLFIGDVHGMVDKYEKIVDSVPENVVTVALGDMGIGFPKHPDITERYNKIHAIVHTDRNMNTSISGRARYFIRGNHDNPEACIKSLGFLGEYGCKGAAWGESFFYVGGGLSIDRKLRTEGVSWWPNEQLSSTLMEEAMELWRASGHYAQVMLSHSCPTMILRELFGVDYSYSATSQFLQNMFEQRSPILKYWIFGHLHKSYRRKIAGVWFIGLDELETITLHDLRVGCV